MKDYNDIAKGLLSSYGTIGGINHHMGPNLPSRESVARIVEDLSSLAFPGYHTEDRIDIRTLEVWVDERLARVCEALTREAARSLRFSHWNSGKCADEEACVKEAHEIVIRYMAQFPEIRRILRTDVDAAFSGDPAAKSDEEVLLSYPCIEAMIVYRFANPLWKAGLPLIPRMMSEYVHSRTGIDIHPGATIGESFFIDHGTGVVIGETTIIGNGVKLYQGVTLGALSVRKSSANSKRHPTIEDDVTIYAGATILGGDTVIGRGSTIGGNVFITASVPPETRAYNAPSDVVMKPIKKRPAAEGEPDEYLDQGAFI